MTAPYHLSKIDYMHECVYLYAVQRDESKYLYQHQCIISIRSEMIHLLR